MQNLNLSSTRMSVVGATKIAEALLVNTTLKNLNMSHLSLLESDGVKAIADCIKKNFTLQSLDVSSCNIKLSAANMFAEIIRKNNGLYSLNLSENAHDDPLKFNIYTCIKSARAILKSFPLVYCIKSS